VEHKIDQIILENRDQRGTDVKIPASCRCTVVLSSTRVGIFHSLSRALESIRSCSTLLHPGENQVVADAKVVRLRVAAKRTNSLKLNYHDEPQTQNWSEEAWMWPLPWLSQSDASMPFQAPN